MTSLHFIVSHRATEAQRPTEGNEEGDEGNEGFSFLCVSLYAPTGRACADLGSPASVPLCEKGRDGALMLDYTITDVPIKIMSLYFGCKGFFCGGMDISLGFLKMCLEC